MAQHHQADQEQVGRAEHRLRPFQHRAADHLFPGGAAMAPLVAAKGYRHSRRDQQTAAGQDHDAARPERVHPLGRDQGADNGADRAAGHDAPEQALRLAGGEDVRHETPEHGHDEQVEHAQPDVEHQLQRRRRVRCPEPPGEDPELHDEKQVGQGHENGTRARGPAWTETWRCTASAGAR